MNAQAVRSRERGPAATMRTGKGSLATRPIPGLVGAVSDDKNADAVVQRKGYHLRRKKRQALIYR